MLVVPQIGNLTATRKEAGRLEGRTDQGCTWTFKDNGSSSELDPAPQSCFNKVIGSSYTITHWFSNSLSSFLMDRNLFVTCSSYQGWKNDRSHDGIRRS